jgi:protein gp37
MSKSKIEWTDATWNPITGCSKISPGCDHRTFHRDKLDEPLGWKKPRRIFICSMADWMHDDVDPQWIDDILEVVAACPQHTFLTLTKRPGNFAAKLYGVTRDCPCRELGGGDYLPNLWLGVTAENQEQADKRIPILLQIPAAKRFVSVEPMLGPILLTSTTRCPLCGGCGSLQSGDHNWSQCVGCGGWGSWSRDYLSGLDWVILGGETGPGARPMDTDWARAVRDQCQDAGVPFFFKGGGANPILGCPPGEESLGQFREDGSARYWKLEGNLKGRLLDGGEWNQFPEVAK